MKDANFLRHAVAEFYSDAAKQGMGIYPNKQMSPYEHKVVSFYKFHAKMEKRFGIKMDIVLREQMKKVRRENKGVKI